MPNRSRLALVVAVAVALGAGCSDSETGDGPLTGGETDDASEPGPSGADTGATGGSGDDGGTASGDDGAGGQPVDDTDPFATPDPAGATRLERLGARPLADEADALVSARYLDPYLAVAASLPDLADADALLGGTATVDCPNGGSAAVTRVGSPEPGRSLARDFAFDACGVAGTRLDGRLALRETLSGSRFSTDLTRESTLEALRIAGEDGAAATVTGTVTTFEQQLSVPTCSAVPASTAERTFALESVRIEVADEPSSLRNVRYTVRDQDGFGDRNDCTRTRTLAFDGAADAALPDGAGATVAVTLSKRGTLNAATVDGAATVGVPVTEEAVLASSAADGSSVTVTATDVGAGLARFDLVSGDVVTAVVDEFAFAP